METIVRIKLNDIISKVDERLFSSFIEHMGRAVYEGIYEPGHVSSDEEGLRKDVIELCRELDISLVRYPGGNFVSGYDWEDSIGLKENRPIRLDLAWQSIETNQFGLHEFMNWSKKINARPMMAVNLGTKGINEARDILEYCNFPGGTYWSELRKKNGQEQPFDIKTWCLGNEMDGPWQIGHKTAEEYGRLAQETAKVMKLVDPSIELVVCGSSYREMPTFGDWERTVLRKTYEYVDYLSLHQYYGNQNDNISEYLARAVEMDQFIKEVVDICDEIQNEKKSNKKIMLSFDEWNIWYHTLESDKEQSLWQVAPPILQDIYNFEDALLLGSMMITLLKNADRVKIACLAQLVNVIAPIMTEKNGKSWKQTTYYPFQQVSCNGRGTVIKTEVKVDNYYIDNLGSIPYIDSTSVYDEEEKLVTIFVVNRHVSEKSEAIFYFDGFKIESIIECTELADCPLKEINTRDRQTVTPKQNKNSFIQANKLKCSLKPLSWNMICLKIKD